MANQNRRITELPLETKSQIRSAVEISSISHVILELIKNCLDAEAGKIHICLDFAKGYCSVRDDGYGILKDEFIQGHLGREYYTSRGINSQHSYGRYGRFLAALSSVSILSITSSHKDERSANTIAIRNGKSIGLSPDIEANDLGGSKHGTKVVVHNLFGNLPVRVKHRTMKYQSEVEVEKKFVTLQRSLVGIVLAAQRSFSLDVRAGPWRYTHNPVSNSTGQEDEAIKKNFITSALYQASLLESRESTSWRYVTLNSSSVSLQAVINLQASPSKDVQFISVNQYSLPFDLAKTVTDQINLLFDASNFGIQEENHSDYQLRVQDITEPRTQSKKVVDRWPMFYIRINPDVGAFPGVTNDDTSKLVTSISGMLHALIKEFLESNDFSLRRRSPKKRRLPQALGSSNNKPDFGNWSRIKTGTGLPADMLSGLPFMHQPQSSIIKTDSDQSVSHDPYEASIQWINPKTGNMIQLNPRTGMALPIHGSKSLPTTYLIANDITSALRIRIPRVHVEKPLKSVVCDPASFNSKHDHDTMEHACILEGGKSIHITGSALSNQNNLTLTREELRTANVLGQVDRKFILASLVSDDAHDKLILVDQHAADERVQVEELFQKVLKNNAVPLAIPILFKVSKQEARRFNNLQAYFATWEIRYTISTNQIRVLVLPELIAERCRLEPKLLINILRTEIWQDRVRQTEGHHWLSELAACPQGVLDMLISRACRSAIMFNDKLSLQQCQELIQRLCDCSFPFQCAHGRPSLTILVQFRDMEETKERSFGEVWKAWK